MLRSTSIAAIHNNTITAHEYIVKYEPHLMDLFVDPEAALREVEEKAKGLGPQYAGFLQEMDSQVGRHGSAGLRAPEFVWELALSREH